MKYYFETTEFVFFENKRKTGFHIFDERNLFGWLKTNRDVLQHTFKEYCSWASYFVPFDIECEVTDEKNKWIRTEPLSGKAAVFMDIGLKVEKIYCYLD